jgi:ribose 5-phosphate isomerase B
MNNVTIAIGSDHAGFELKQEMCNYLTNKGYSMVDLGPNSADSVDYPDFAHNVASSVETGITQLGILICGSGNGVCITANKHHGVRAALAWAPELASLARQHNNANVICLPARFISQETAFEIADAYLESAFEGGRHETRVNKIEAE